LYLQVIKPLAPTRPQLIKIKTALETINPQLTKAIGSKPVQVALEKAKQSTQKSTSFLRLLQAGTSSTSIRNKEQLDKKVMQLRKQFFGNKANKKDFNITLPSNPKKEEFTLHIRFKRSDFEQTLKELQELMRSKTTLQDLLPEQKK
jgi:ParB family chromosome partitioning protein